jgi:protein tyrosine phosphatase
MNWIILVRLGRTTPEPHKKLGLKSYGLSLFPSLFPLIHGLLSLPTPEGLSPTSPADLDEHLSIVIDNYTLKGKDVLVHCRGGVGRAGVFAACWLLRLGLCGWIETEVRTGDRSLDGVMQEVGAGLGLIRRDTLQMVERAIAVVRRRRSVKAVETYEQVKFLVDFVDYLRECKERMEAGV